MSLYVAPHLRGAKKDVNQGTPPKGSPSKGLPNAGRQFKTPKTREEMIEHYKLESIFRRYGDGIRLSDSMIYSVTREDIANEIAAKAKQRGMVGAVDGCGGAGGNTIAFAREGLQTVHVEINESTLEDAKHNARVYGVEDKISFHKGSILEFDCLKESGVDPATAVFFSSPEWGGPSYRSMEVFDVELCNPKVSELVKYVRDQGFAETCLFLPRTSNIEQLKSMGFKEFERMYQDGRCNAICAWL